MVPDLDTGAGIQTDPSLTGDTKSWAFGNGAPYDFYGTDVDAFGFTDDGFVGFSDVSWAAASRGRRKRCRTPRIRRDRGPSVVRR